MKKISNIFSLFLITCLTGALASCSFWDNTIEEKESAKSSVTDIISDSKDTFTLSGSISLTEGALPASILQSSTGSISSRAAMPEIPSELTYSVIASDGTNELIGTVTDSTNHEYELVLACGTEWTVTAVVKDSSDMPVLSDTWTIPAANQKKNLFHRFWVKPVATNNGSGELGLSIVLNNDLDGLVSKVIAECKSDNSDEWEATVSPNEDITFAANSTVSISISDNVIKSGQYEVNFSFYNDANILVYNTVQTINICDNLTTNTWVSGGGSSPIKADGTFELTKDLVDGYSRTTLYVGKTNLTDFKADDSSANGSPVKPFASITGAVSYLKKVGSSEQDYTIYVVGTLTDAQEITDVDSDGTHKIPANSITLVGVSGLDGTTHEPKDSIEVTRDSSALIISTEVPVTVKDLKITKGTGRSHGVHVNSSSKFYLAGTPVIDDLYLEDKGYYSVCYDGDYSDTSSLFLAEDLGIGSSVTITPSSYTAPSFDSNEGGYVSKDLYVSVEEGSSIEIANNSKYFQITPELDENGDTTATEWIIDNEGCLNYYCTLTFAGEDTNSMSTQKVPCTYFRPGELTIPERSGYRFTGWYLNLNNNMEQFDYREDYYDEDGEFRQDTWATFVTSDMTLYATWICLTINDIHVDTNYGADGAWCTDDGNTINLGDGSEAHPLRTLTSALDLIKEIDDSTKDYTITISGLTNVYNLPLNSDLPIKSLTLEGKTSAETDGIDMTSYAYQLKDKNFVSVLPVSIAAPVRIQNMLVRCNLSTTLSDGSDAYSVDGSIMNIGEGATVTLENGTVFEGVGSTTTTRGAVAIENGGTLIMNEGVTFQNFNIKCGAVNVKEGGTFTMNGGTFTNNKSSVTCGAVYVNGGTFTMKGGDIKDNLQYYFQRDNTPPHGTGVCVASGTFIMEGGYITGNKSGVPDGHTNMTTAGGGVFVHADGTFIMRGGEISDNHAYNRQITTAFIIEDEIDPTAHSYGGGVCLEASGNKIASFTMTGGTISGNTAGTSGNGIGFLGTPNEGVTGTITLGGDAIIASNNDIYLPNFMTITIASELSGITEDNKVYITTPSHTEGTQVVEIEEDAGISLANVCENFTVRPLTGVAKLSSTGTLLEGHITLSELETVLPSLKANDASTPYKIVITDSVSDFASTNETLKSIFDTAKKYVTLSFLNASFTSMEGVLSEYITSLTIPASVTSVGFIDAGENFSSFAVASGNSTFTASSGILYANSGKTIVRYPPATTATTVNIASNITAISDGAFVGCKNIEAFTVSSGNTSFKVTSGGSFSASTYDVKAYQTANYFNYDSSISTTAPAFTITVDGKSQMNPEYTTWANKISAQYISLGSVTVGGLLTSYDETTLIACPPALTLYTNDDIKDMCGGYEKDQGGNTITYDASTRLYLYFDNVKPYALCGVKNVQSITLGVEATSVPAYTFKDCSGLKYVDLTTTGSTISAYTFCDCTALEEVAFKSTTINTVESNALYGCIGLKKLYFEAGETTGIAGTASDAYPASCGSVYIYGKVN